jgi:hypothetical protein
MLDTLVSDLKSMPNLPLRALQIKSIGETQNSKSHEWAGYKFVSGLP